MKRPVVGGRLCLPSSLKKVLKNTSEIYHCQHLPETGTWTYASVPCPSSINAHTYARTPLIQTPGENLTMKPVDLKPEDEASKIDVDEKQKDGEEGKVSPPSASAEIKANVALIERAVATLEPRFMHRVLRTLTALRKRLDDKALREAIAEVYPQGALIIFFALQRHLTCAKIRRRRRPCFGGCPTLR